MERLYHLRAYGLLLGLVMVIGVNGLSSTASAAEIDVWGVAHLSADAVDDGDDTNGHIASNSSRLAISGNQEISDALEFVFQYESGVDLTGQGGNDGNGGAASDGQLFTRTRDAFAGLKGAFGTVTLGRVGGLNQWVYDYNLFADQVGDLGNIWGGTGLAGRIDSTAQYISPEFGGFTGKVVYAPEEGVDDTDILVLKGDYVFNENLKVGVAFMNQGMGSSPGVKDHKALALTGSYSTDRFSVGGGYQRESDAGGVNGADADSFTIGGAINAGTKGMFKAQFTFFDGDAPDSDANQLAVGYDYSASDSATLYLAFAAVDNDPNAAFMANNYGHGDAVVPLAGNDPWVISLGFVYKFNVNILSGAN